MKKYKIIITLMMYILIILLGTKVYAVTGTAIEETTRIRQEANSTSKIIALVSMDEKVEILSEEGEWYKVKYTSEGKTYTGYIRSDLLKVDGKVEKSDSSKKEESNTTSNEKEEKNSTENNVTNNAENNTENNNTSEENNINSESNQETLNETDNENSINEENSVNTNDAQKEQTAILEIKENDKVKINKKINIKVLPLINSNQIGTIKKNSEITIIEIIGNWYHIEINNQIGWIVKSDLEVAIEQNDAQATENSKDDENTENNEEQNKDDENQEKTEQENKDNNTEKDNTSTTKTLYVNTETLNLREKPENTAKILKQLSINNKVTIVEEVDKTWSKVTISGVTGYVASKYLSEEKTKVTSRGLNETRSSVNDTDNNDEQNNNSNDTSSNISNSTDTSSNNSSSSQSSTSNNGGSSNTSSSNSSSKTTGADIVAYAKQYLGCKYVMGGTSPSGFDCSGFTQYVYKHFGYSISRTSSTQRSDGIAVKKTELQAGDIVCFSGHVGIYIGGNNFIHASNPSDGVKITSLSDSYYVKSYITARRILK